MLIRRSALIMSLLILICLLSCKKYPDNPILSGSPESNIVGDWDVEYLYVNGVDSTAYFKADTCYFGFTFLSHEQSGGLSNIGSPCQGCKNCITYGVYYFVNDKKDLQLGWSHTSWQQIGNLGFVIHGVDWQINKLTSDELWIQSDANSLNTWVHFKKK